FTGTGVPQSGSTGGRGGRVTNGLGSMSPVYGAAGHAGNRLQRIGDRGARPAPLFNPEIVSAEIGSVIGVPDAGMVQRKNPRRCRRQYRTFQVSLLPCEILGQPRAGIVNIVNTPRTIEVASRLERSLCRHPVIGMIPRIGRCVRFCDV